MQKLNILNTRDKKRLFEELIKQFGSTFDQQATLCLTEKERLYLVSASLNEWPDRMRADSMGLYIGTWDQKSGSFRPSIEGSQLLGKKASSHIINLNKEQAEDWMKGEHVTINQSEDKVPIGIYLIRHQDDFYGSAKAYIDDKKGFVLLNHVPKERRLRHINW